MSSAGLPRRELHVCLFGGAGGSPLLAPNYTDLAEVPNGNLLGARPGCRLLGIWPGAITGSGAFGLLPGYVTWFERTRLFTAELVVVALGWPAAPVKSASHCVPEASTTRKPTEADFTLSPVLTKGLRRADRSISGGLNQEPLRMTRYVTVAGLGRSITKPPG